MRRAVCVVGSLNADLIFRTERMPVPGETRSARSFQLASGGKGANQAVMASRLGAAVTMIGRTGADPFGQQLRDALQAQGIETQHIGIDPLLPTGVAGILVDDDGQNCIVVAAGANGALTAAHVCAAAEAIQAARVVLCQLETPLTTTLEAFRLARAAKVQTVLTPAPARPLPDELLQLTDVCVLNELEAACLVGASSDPAVLARALRRRGPGVVIVTLGAQGCFVAGPEGEKAFAAPAVVAVDTTGAGDAFVGALAAELAAGSTLAHGIERASAAAALSVTRAGAQPSYPSRAEVDAFLRQSAR